MIDQFIDRALARSRTTLSVMVFLMFFGIVSFIALPVELEPSIEVPFVIVTLPHEGISPEDAERLLVSPLEVEFRSLEGLKEMTSYAAEGAATVTLEFEVEMTQDESLLDVREAIDRAREKIPRTAEEPIVSVISTAEFPALVINLVSTGSQTSERLLYSLARELRDRIAALPEVLEATISGHREELLEIVVDPALLESYNISQAELGAITAANNRLIAAGFLDKGQGRFAIKVPGLIETADDLFDVPIKIDGDSVITLGEVTTIRRTYKDREAYSHVNGQFAISVEVTKRIHANLITTAAKVKAIAAKEQANYPKSVGLHYTSDLAPLAERQLQELMGNIFTAMMLVIILVIATLGLRSGLLVGCGIPVSFLTSYIILNAIGYTFNFMVMFGLLLALGILIDGAIVVTEYADRKLLEGHHRRHAYAMAAKRMFWPVTASTATTLAVFLPLFIWPGVSGKFMQYLPVTVFTVLVSSLAYALIFGPTLGSLFGKAGRRSAEEVERIKVLETGDPTTLSGFTGIYARALRHMTKHAILVTLTTIAVLIGSFVLYATQGVGLIFYTDQDPSWASVSIQARGNLSVEEIRSLSQEVESKILRIAGVQSMYLKTVRSSALGGFRSRGSPQDKIASIILALHEPHMRTTTGKEVLAEIRRQTASIAGIEVHVKALQEGPPTGKAVQIQLSSNTPELLEPALARIRHYMDTEVQNLRDIDDTRLLPGVEWKITVDRARAAQLGANVSLVGNTVQLITNGVKLGEYRPDDADEEVDIRLRYPEQERGLAALQDLRVNTAGGPIPIASFVDMRPQPKIDTIQRVDGVRVEFVRSSVEDGILADDKVQEIQRWISEQNFDPRLNIVFRGANEEQDNARAFLSVAFALALLLMFIMLVTQFDSFYQSFLIMFTVVMSTAGVLLGLVITGKPFSVILTGVGIVSLAGIIVNNNIVLIDTYNHIRTRFPMLSREEIIIRTGAQRLRPVVLTTVTTVFGLLAIASHLSIDLINRQVTYGGTVTAPWVPLASSIVSGLIFATPLTLITTPAMLALPDHFGWVKRLWPGSQQPTVAGSSDIERAADPTHI